MNITRSPYAESVESIEAAYEHFLAFAAQGDRGDSGAAESARQHLSAMERALASLPDAARQSADAAGLSSSDPETTAALLHRLSEDAASARALVAFAARSPRTSSKIVDSLIASHHLRALLTTVYLLDAVMDQGARG